MRASLLWLPNAITLTRLALIFPLVIVLGQRDYDSALILIVIGLVSDCVDGLIARRLDCQSDLGCLLDAVADRLLVIAGMALLASQGFVPNWLFLLVLGRDLMLLIMALHAAQRLQRITLMSTLAGKLSSFLQFVYLVMVLLQLVQTGVNVGALANTVMAVMVVIVSLGSGLHYAFRYWRGALSQRYTEPRQTKTCD